MSADNPPGSPSVPLDAQANGARLFLIAVGEAAYGDEWKAGIAKDLGRALGRTVSRSQVHHWASGERAVPLHLREHIVQIAFHLRNDLKERADRIDALLKPPKRRRTSRKPTDG